MREVLVESVKWKREDIRHSALKIISFYSHDLPHLGTSKWINLAARIIPVVMGNRNPSQVQLAGDAFELVFHPPRPTLIPHIKDGIVVWEEREYWLILSLLFFQKKSMAELMWIELF